MKKTVSLLICLVMLVSLTSCARVKLIGTGLLAFVNSDIDNYEKSRADIEYALEHLPPLDELGEYECVSYSHQHTTMLLFESDAIALFVKYAPEVYCAQQSALTAYDDAFLKETELSPDGAHYQSAPAEFNYNGYSFRTAINPDVYENTGSRCKSFAMIGTNDDECTVAYLYFYDMDLDTIAETNVSESEMISEFIDEYFAWEDAIG